MFRNVAWATDGSPHADRALEYARELMPPEGGTLHVIHVVEKLVGPRVAGQNASFNEPEMEAKVKRQAHEVAEQGVDVKVHVRTGRAGEVAHTISAIAAEAGPDVIVIGTRGHSAVLAAVIGSVTQRLLHVADCPVLAVPPARHEAKETKETKGAEASEAVTAKG
ncbi:MAG TPA: universal stress protein [Solirubrobacteraceae bacterium]|nr:universal stress protein [Solirubrobacteraceae bacterium]